MSLLREVPLAEVTSDEVRQTYQRLFGDRDPTVEPGTATGTPGSWWTVFALEPELFSVMRHRQAWQSSPAREIDPKLRELALARTGWARGSQFVFSQHCKAMRMVGHSEEKIEAIPSWSSEHCFDEVERVVLGYTDDLVMHGGRVPPARAKALKAALSDVAILELTFLITTYLGSATISRALRLEFDDRDDPIVEVPAPADAGAPVWPVGVAGSDSSH